VAVCAQPELPLATVLRRAGAVFARRGGSEVPVDYGSVAGELAVCVSAVGLVSRGSLTDVELGQLHGASFADGFQAQEWSAIELVGPRTNDVLHALRVPGSLAPFASAPIGNVPAHWLLKSDRRALALVPAAAAGEAWSELEQAGRPVGISCVGWDAASRYELIERTRRP
jgi:glycine cleavage system aminomethyltransferase T